MQLRALESSELSGLQCPRRVMSGYWVAGSKATHYACATYAIHNWRIRVNDRTSL